jgi:UPF0271 protein
MDLNADLGEHDGEGYAADEGLLAVVSSASIACGAHAGSTAVMTETAQRAAAMGVAIGAHPSYPDREGFGRRDMALPLPEIVGAFRVQVEAMLTCAERARTRVGYVKPHGALYNRAMTDRDLAETLAACVVDIDRDLVLLALPDGELAKASHRSGLRAAREGFVDRAYDSDGRLVARAIPGAVLHNVQTASDRAVAIASGKTIESIDGKPLLFQVHSLCVHSDSDHALEMLSATREKLERAGFSIRAFSSRS